MTISRDELDRIAERAKREHLRSLPGGSLLDEEDEPDEEPPLLPELVINEADPTATAKELAALIAWRDEVLFNGYAPVRIAVEADELPRALELTTEAVRVYAHELCRPIKLRKTKKRKILRSLNLEARTKKSLRH